MPSFETRLDALKKRQQDKTNQINKLKKSIDATKENIKVLSSELMTIEEDIKKLESRMLIDMLNKNGVGISDLAVMLKTGGLGNTVPDNSEVEDTSEIAEDDADYSMENYIVENDEDTEKEKLDE